MWLQLLLLISGLALVSSASAASTEQLQELLATSVELPHDEAPSGVPENWTWGKAGRVNLGNDPGTFRSFIIWGQIYKAAGAKIPIDTKVQIRNLVACSLSKKEPGHWRPIQKSSGVTGKAYVEDFKDDHKVETEVNQLSDGSTAMQFKEGYNLHFFPLQGRVSIDPTDIAGIYVVMEARIIPVPARKILPNLLISAGADYWLNNSAKWDHFKTNNDAVIGRFRRLSESWQLFAASTIGASALKKHPPDCTY